MGLSGEGRAARDGVVDRLASIQGEAARTCLPGFEMTEEFQQCAR